MKTKANNHGLNPGKYSFSKKPVYYFHADEDFREDREWGKEKSKERAVRNSSMSQAADNAVM